MIDKILTVGEFITKGGKQALFNLIVILLIVAFVVGYIWWHDKQIEQAGYDRCLVEQQELKNKAEAEDLKRLKVKIAKLEKEKREANQYLENMNAVIFDLNQKNNQLEFEISEYGKKNATADCNILDAEFIRLYENAIGEEPSL